MVSQAKHNYPQANFQIGDAQDTFQLWFRYTHIVPWYDSILC
jgi:hypothetical protein